ncbi:MAG TPA: HyaD/HybD family hydrogenase maturation endopeptidase [Pseudorhodoferax sp.]|nr:HyaD/HybD family hydrogenase maturation endopeptidase [Pseudorhodoferax sp.]
MHDTTVSTLPERICVLGIGNLLWADEGFGVRCVEALAQRHDFAPHVALVDGGTQGLYLLPQVQQADALLILDAVDYGLAPGQLQLVRDDEVPRFLGAKKMSLHQTGFQEVLALAQFTGRYPRHVLLLGCQPEVLDDYGGSLTPVVRAAMEQALTLAVQQIADWGGQPVPRRSAAAPREQLSLDALALAAYEAGRPSAQDACRVGDARFLADA